MKRKEINPYLDVALAMVKNVHFETVMRMMAISQADWEKTLGNALWSSQDRTSVRTVMDSLLFGTLDVIGLPRVNLCAEYVCAFITIFVSPINWLVACRFYENASHVNAVASAREGFEQAAFEPGLSADRLVALCVKFAASSRDGTLDVYRNEMMKKMTPLPEQDVTPKP